MTSAQNNLYWRLWAAAKKALIAGGLSPKEADARRHELHKDALGEDKSHIWFSNTDFDKIIAAFRAVSEPANYRAQLRQTEQPRTRQLALIRQLCGVLGKGDRWEAYALGILRKMNREGALHGRDLLLEQLTDAQFDRLLIALKKACRREWPTKEHLLGAVLNFVIDHDIDQDAASSTVCAALHSQHVVPEQLTYEQLLTVLHALQTFAGQLVDEPF